MNSLFKKAATAVFCTTAVILLCVIMCSAQLSDGFSRYDKDWTYVPQVGSIYNGPDGASALPSRYDLRDENRITSVKDQGEYGCCWAFSMIAASESSLITEMPERFSQPDLSELHLVYYSFSRNSDPLGFAAGDYVRIFPSTLNFLNLGGNLYMATFSLAKWVGVADDSVLPYSLADKNMSAPASDEYRDVAHLENAEWIDMSDTDAVKKAIMDDGAVAIPYYSDEYTYFNEETGAYFCDYSNISPLLKNHAVTVVGWDDSYPRENFGGITGKRALPADDGAWLIKNSYGTEYGNDGYIWLSYEDYSLNGSTAVSLDYALSDNYENNYQYDGGQGFSYYEIENGGYMANVFTACNDELLKAVSFYTAETNVKYDVKIYTSVSDAANPESGTCETASRVTGTLNSAGYHTIRLPRVISLEKNQRFSVVVRLMKSGESVSLLSDATSSLGSGMLNVTSSSAGQSFIREDGGDWFDLNENGLHENLRIKAFTDKGYINTDKITLNATSAAVAFGGRRKLSMTLTPSNATNRIKWSSSNTSVARVASDGTVTGVACGTCVVTATAVYGGASASCRITVRPATVAGLKCTAISDNSYTLVWNRVSGATSYQVFRYDTKLARYVHTRTVTATSITLSGFSACTKNQYRVRAVRVAGSKLYYGGLSAVCYAATVRSMGSSLSISAYTDTAVTLKWKAAAGVSGYRVYMKTGSSAYKLLKNTTALSYKAISLTPNTKYLFKIVAYVRNSSNIYEGKASNIVTVITRPSVPKGLTITTYSQSTVTLSWSAVSGATGYAVYRYDAKNGWKYVGSTTSKSCVVNNLSPASAYYFKVRAYTKQSSGNIYGYYSSACKGATSPAKMKINSIRKASSTSAKVLWNRVSADGYEVYVKFSSFGSFKKAGDFAASNAGCTVSSFVRGRTYYFKVRAYKLINGTRYYGAYSDAVKYVH